MEEDIPLEDIPKGSDNDDDDDGYNLQTHQHPLMRAILVIQNI